MASEDYIQVSINNNDVLCFFLVIYFATEPFNVSSHVSHYNSIERAPSLQLMLWTAVNQNLQKAVRLN